MDKKYFQVRPRGAVRGRGAAVNPHNRFEAFTRETFDDGWGGEAAAVEDVLDECADDGAAEFSAAAAGVLNSAAHGAAGLPCAAAGGAAVSGRAAALAKVSGGAGAAGAGHASARVALAGAAGAGHALAGAAGGEGRAPETVIHWDNSRTIISKNESPDIPHKLSANPYRGCEHGCVYCFARPSHAYLGFSPGLDFETQLFAKKDAPQLLRQALARPRYTPQPLALGIITDAYQPAERKLKITRQMLEILHDCRHPVSLITKSALIERDVDILSDMARQGLADVAVSITSLDNDLTRRLEARAAAPQRRLKVIENLAAAGVPVTVMQAPLIPAVTDSEIERILAAAAQAGATGAGYIVLRLPRELKEVFRDWLHKHLPQRAEKVMSQVRAIHGGRDYNPQFFTRHRGEGVLAAFIASRFERARRQYGLERRRARALRCDLFRRPGAAGRQLGLF